MQLLVLASNSRAGAGDREVIDPPNYDIYLAC